MRAGRNHEKKLQRVRAEALEPEPGIDLIVCILLLNGTSIDQTDFFPPIPLGL